MEIFQLLIIVVVPALLITTWPSFSRSVVFPALFGVAISWLFLVLSTEVAIAHTMLNISERQLAGLPVEEWEVSYDGVGDRVAVIFLGWLFPTVVATFVLIGRWLRRRHNQQMQLTGSLRG